MTTAVTLRVLLAVAACTSLLVLTKFSDDVFFSDFQAYQVIENVSPSGEVEVVGDAHLYRIPSTVEVVLRMAVPMFALIGVAAYVASWTAVRKVWAGAAASLCAVLITLAVQWVMATKFWVGDMPHARIVAVWSVGALAIGATTSWITAVWWPNKSLERTRDK